MSVWTCINSENLCKQGSKGTINDLSLKPLHF